MPNRLASEKSPYLLQHADNPVDWYPWGPEALAKAAAEELLTFGFFEEVLNRLSADDLHDALRTLIQTKFKK